MDIFTEFMGVFNAHKLISILFFLVLIVMFALMLLALFEMLMEKKKADRIKGLKKESKITEKFKNLSYLKTYAENLEKLLIEKNKEERFSFVFQSTLIFLVVIFVSMVLVKQYLLSVVLPFVMLKLSNKLCIVMMNDINDSIEEQLPFVIDNIIRISSKYGDVKSIIHETSRTSPEVMKRILEDMSRRMISETPEVVLLEFAKKYDNVWFYSFIFTLVSYLEDATKEETINNLRALRDILEKENNIKRQNVTDKKMGVAINLSICGLSVVAFLINLIAVPGAKEFFFSTFGGLVCFLVGFACIIQTIFTSVSMSKRGKDK